MSLSFENIFQELAFHEDEKARNKQVKYKRFQVYLLNCLIFIIILIYYGKSHNKVKI